MCGRKPKEVVLQELQRDVLQKCSRDGKLEWRVVRRAHILLQLAGGKNPCQVAEAVGCYVNTVRYLRDRFYDRGVDVVYDAPRSGRPPEISPPR